MSLPCSVRDLIPQKGKMGFEQTIIKTQPEDSESTAIINRDNIFLDDGLQLSNIALIEYVNQLIAAAQGYNGKSNGKPGQKGLFVGVQEAKFIQPVYHGDCLTIKSFTTEEVSQVTFVQGIIERDGDRVAELVTKLYEVKDESEFNSLTDGGLLPKPKRDIPVSKSQPPVYLAFDMHRVLYSYLHDKSAGEDFISFKIACPEGFDPFDGHFPGNPILPGIVLFEIANLGLKLLLKKPVGLKYLKRMKISGVVHPYQVISCTVKIDKNSDPLVSFSAIFNDDGDREISKFTGTCGEGKE